MLPYPGDMNAQPAYVYDAIQACNHEERVIQKEAAEEAERKRPK